MLKPAQQWNGAINAYAPSAHAESQKKRRPRPDPTGSKLLTRPENELMFDILGPNRISLAAAVVQLLKAVSGRWQHEHVGVVSLVKDYDMRLYKLVIFDIYSGNELWSQIMYRHFQARSYSQSPKFLTFESDSCVYGFNFSDESEALDFKDHLEKRYQEEQKSDEKSTNSIRRTAPSVPTTRTPVPKPGITDVGSMPHFGIYHGSAATDNKKNKSKDKKNKKKPKIRKEDIGHPTNFQHKAHLGWDVDGGFSQVCTGEPLDESVKEMIRAAGQNPDRMRDDEVAFAKDFISKYQPPPELNEPSYSQQSQMTTPISRTNAMINRDYPKQNNISAWNEERTTVYNPEPQLDYRAPSYKPGYQQPYTQTYQSHQHPAANSYVPPSSYQQTPPPAPQRDASMTQTNQHRPLRPPPMEPRAPPVASYTSQQTTNTPAPPPPPPPMPSLARQDSRESRPNPPPPPPPPPPSAGGAPPAPPPPPPPGPLNNNPVKPSPPSAPKPAVSGGRADLLQQIQMGTKLKHVDPPAEKSPLAPSAGNNRDDMMNQIRQGAQLKHVDQTEVESQRKSVPSLQQIGGIAGALARALEERRRNMNNSDTDSDNENDSEWEDD